MLHEGGTRKLAAIMFTDMVGYSALTQRNEALALALLHEQQQLVRPIFAQYSGREVKSTGDGFLVEFASALQAVRCALEIQKEMVQRNSSAAPERRMQLRIGLHLGDVETRDGDVFGDGVNIAARVEPFADAGGICITGPVFDQVRNKFDEPLERLRQAAEKALELDPSLAEPHTWLGSVHWWYDRDYAAARRELETAIAMQPDLASAHEVYGWYLVATGQVDEGLAESRRAVELDPLSPETNAFLGVNLYLARRYDEAVKQLRAAINTDPDYVYAHLFLGRVYARMGRFSEATAELRTAVRLAPVPEQESALGRAYADAGDRDKATVVLNRLREQMRDTFVSAAFLATMHIGLGEMDKAFAALEEAATQHSYYVPWWKLDPELDPLRSDPRFTALLKKVGFQL